MTTISSESCCERLGSLPNGESGAGEGRGAGVQKQGYKVALLINEFTVAAGIPKPDMLLQVGEYPGYWRSCNALARAILASDQDFEVLVCAADDMTPDPDMRAAEIAAEYLERYPTGFGVMQPTGDDLLGTDKICGSPWMGRGWIEERGPYHEGYMQFYGDEELLYVAKQLGVLRQRPDLTQYHEHWSRAGKATKTDYQVANDRFWAADKRLFEERRKNGWPV